MCPLLTEADEGVKGHVYSLTSKTPGTCRTWHMRQVDRPPTPGNVSASSSPAPLSPHPGPTPTPSSRDRVTSGHLDQMGRPVHPRKTRYTGRPICIVPPMDRTRLVIVWLYAVAAEARLRRASEPTPLQHYVGMGTLLRDFPPTVAVTARESLVLSAVGHWQAPIGPHKMVGARLGRVVFAGEATRDIRDRGRCRGA